ncbi:DEAD/DEAH box helicase [Leptolyngbya sp. AN02str]|uniref:DEAD/DEAH box helicase n=1 Tax=Leptolyngbya sp. AN02str TaxID=3423363 RepID=UPI003D31CCAE
MATIIPALSTCAQRMTPGERRLAQRLETKLENDYLLWYDVPVGRKRLHPDFVILHPERGIIVLEAKDWKLSTIQQLDPDQVTLLLPDGTKTVENPLNQARGYALAIASLLEQDPLLVQGTGRHQGKLVCPYSYGLILTNLTRKQFDSADMGAVLEPHLVICQDEMYEDVDPLEFQERLWSFCTYSFGEPLNAAQIDRVRWHLFPEVRIGVQLSLLPDEPNPEPESITVPDLIQVMDLQQEQLARSLGEGHRVIHGVAGSGKTLILVYRCLKLVEELNKPILVLCFNKALAARLRYLLMEKGIGDRQVTVRSFHKWCADLLQEYRIPTPSRNQFQGEAYAGALVQRVIDAVDAQKIPAGQYGAVMIDEGHDFQPGWFKLTVQMVDPETNSLLVLYDDAQSIYDRQRSQKFSFKSVGVQAQGRTTILKINYRNTQEILSLAYAFAQEWLTPEQTQLETTEESEDAPVLIKPQSAGRHGAKPQLIKLPSFSAEADYIAQRTQQFYESGTAWGEMAVVYRAKWMAEKVGERLEQAGIPVAWLNQTENYDSVHASIKLVTMHSSKGLEFPVVFIPGLGYLPNPHEAPKDEARLLYVGMTRAIDQLVMTGDRASAFIKRLDAVVGASQ